MRKQLLSMKQGIQKNWGSGLSLVLLPERKQQNWRQRGDLLQAFLFKLQFCLEMLAVSTTFSPRIKKEPSSKLKFRAFSEPL